MDEIEKIKSKYIRKEASASEQRVLYQWLRDHPEEKKTFYQEKDVWDSYALVKDIADYSVKEEAGRLKRRIQISKRRSLYIPNLIKIAAIFVLAFIFSWSMQNWLPDVKRSNSLTEFRHVEVPKGQIHQVFLADGSRIWLNSESEIQIPSVFSENERRVVLSGEAFFEVAKDPTKPFKVVVEGQTIEVLGTSFNIRAYPDLPFVQTTLRTGKIKLKSEQEQVILSPGEQTKLDKITGELSLKKVDPSDYYSWKDGRYELKGESLIEVFKIAERWYDVELEYDQSQFKDMYFSVVLKRNKSIEHFLKLLDHSIPIQYEIEMDKIIIKKRTEPM